MVLNYMKELIDDEISFDEWHNKYNDIYQIDRRITYMESIIKDMNLEEKYSCPICGESSIGFMPFGGLLFENEQCASCGSLARQRGLYLIMKHETNIFDEIKNIKILHFAPEPPLYQLFEKKENIEYITADLNIDEFKKELYFFTSGKTLKYFENPDNYIKEKIDVQNIPYEDNTFDYIIINHVLEHVPQDKKAMRELSRVLKSGGVAFISVPIKGEITNEDENINTPELRLKYYDDPTHLRLYGRDIKERLEECGFEVDEYENEKYFSEDEIQLYGINTYDKEFQYVCKAK